MSKTQLLIDQSFYDQFAETAAQRLRDLSRVVARYRDGGIDYAGLIESARLPLHNMTGEARLLDLFDLAQLIGRLSRRLGRMGEPIKAPLSDSAAAHLILCCQTLASLAHAQATRLGHTPETERAAYVEALVAFEQAV